MNDIRKDDEKAYLLYQKAVELDPDHANNIGNYATFLTTKLKDFDKAEELYQKAIALAPNHISNLANYSYLLITHKTAKAAQLVHQYTQRIIKTNKSEPTQDLAEAILYAYLGYELFPTTIKSNPLPRLKSIIKIGFERGSWSFEHMFEVVLPDFSNEKQKFYRALGDAILDGAKVSELETFDEWTDCQEIDVFADFEE